jgi:hypothetical protein
MNYTQIAVLFMFLLLLSNIRQGFLLNKMFELKGTNGGHVILAIITAFLIFWGWIINLATFCFLQ